MEQAERKLEQRPARATNGVHVAAQVYSRIWLLLVIASRNVGTFPETLCPAADPALSSSSKTAPLDAMFT